jgi:hypothetical protein
VQGGAAASTPDAAMVVAIDAMRFDMAYLYSDGACPKLEALARSVAATRTFRGERPIESGQVPTFDLTSGRILQLERPRFAAPSARCYRRPAT